jgi:hypothetical protein
MTAHAPQHHLGPRSGNPAQTERPAPHPSRDREREPRTAPLLAVCGVCGGAGASTLSYLLARFAVTCESGHVLICDTGGPAASLAAIARTESTWSLPELSDRLARELPLTSDVFAIDDRAGAPGSELRVIATLPRLGVPGDPAALQAILEMARSDGIHALTVVDCGTLQRAADRIALRNASHVAWVLPATAHGVRRGRLLLAAIGPLPGQRELLIARREPRTLTPRRRAVKALARQRNAPLILLPELPDEHTDPARALQRAQVGLQAILGALAR